MKFLYAFFIGMIAAGTYCFAMMFFGSGGSPQLQLTFIGVTFVIGFIVGLFDYDRKMKKKEEEEGRKAEQDRTNELMREYLEKKLREDNKNEE